MSTPRLLEGLQRRGVHLWRNGERLAFDGPPEVLTPRVLAAMKASKRELLLLLEAQAAPVAMPSAPVEAKPQVLAAPSPVEVKPEPSEGHAVRLRLACELGGVLEALPGAKRLRSGAWRFERQVWEHDQIVLLAAQRRGSTSGGWALEVDAGQIYREHNPDSEEAQVLAAPVLRLMP